MPILPSKFQPEALPSLGALVREAIAPKVDPIKVFETGDHSAPKWISFDLAASSGQTTAHAEYTVVGDTVTIRSPKLFIKKCLRFDGEVLKEEPTPPIAPQEQQPKFRVGMRVHWGPYGQSGVVENVYGDDGFVMLLLDGDHSGDCCGFTAAQAALELRIIPPEPKATDGCKS